MASRTIRRPTLEPMVKIPDPEETMELSPEQEVNNHLIENLRKALGEALAENEALKTQLEDQTKIVNMPQDQPDPYARFRVKEAKDFSRLIAQLLGDRNFNFTTFPGGFREGAMALRPERATGRGHGPEARAGYPGGVA
jgi:hypothetical protein